MKKWDAKEDAIRGVDLRDDGRNVDESLGTLAGEAARIAVKRPEKAWPLHEAASTSPHEPELTADGLGADGTYYGLPMLKEPVWKWYIPTYFYTGGVAGGAAALGAALQLVGGRSMRPLTRRTRWVATFALVASSGLLIADLGRPARFLNMLRVFRPTSPMNLGTWIVAASGMCSGVGAVLARGPWIIRRAGDSAALAAGVLGGPLAGYTAVLLSNTAVPAWQHARRTLPYLFVASAATGAAACLDLLPRQSDAEERVLRVFGLAGKIAELGAAAAVEHDLSKDSKVARPLRHGTSGALWKLASILTGASLVLSLVPGRSPRVRAARGISGTLGALALRYAVVEIGRASARDPRATFEPQRDAMKRR